MIKKIIKKILRIRFAFGLVNTCFKPGHFYSPIVSLKDIKRRESQIWKPVLSLDIQNISLNSNEQKVLLSHFSDYYSEMGISIEKSDKRYYFNNVFFSYTDAFLLYSMIRHFNPIQIIEVGSGFSSAVMLDTIDTFAMPVKITFIEPFPKRLKLLMKENEDKRFQIQTSQIQDIDSDFFKSLNQNDILFIDSTHVSKTGSDVNYVIFNILPILKKGVLIHFHDIFYPFEYPKQWVYEGRNWNENYLLRAFLMNNNDYKILLFSDYLHKIHKEAFKHMPLCYNNTGGSIWIQKLIDPE